MANQLGRVMDRNHTTSSAEMYFRVFQWLSAHPCMPTWQQVRSHFGVTRATAYRWLSAYRNATGVA